MGEFVTTLLIVLIILIFLYVFSFPVKELNIEKYDDKFHSIFNNNFNSNKENCIKNEQKSDAVEQKVSDAFKNVDPKIVNKLYEMLKLTHKILTKNEITYWITDGTLIGLYRHNTNGEGHIIPWD